MKKVAAGLTLLVAVTLVSVCGKGRISEILSLLQQSDTAKDSIKTTDTLSSTASVLKTTVSVVKIVQGTTIDITTTSELQGSASSSEGSSIGQTDISGGTQGQGSMVPPSPSPKLAPIISITSQYGELSCNLNPEDQSSYFVHYATEGTSVSYHISSQDGKSRKTIAVLPPPVTDQVQPPPLTSYFYRGDCSGSSQYPDLCSSEFDPEVNCSWLFSGKSSENYFCWIGYDPVTSAVTRAGIGEDKNYVYFDSFWGGAERGVCADPLTTFPRTCTIYHAEKCALPEGFQCDKSVEELTSMCSFAETGTAVEFEGGRCTDADWDKDGKKDETRISLWGDPEKGVPGFDYSIRQNERGLIIAFCPQPQPGQEPGELNCTIYGAKCDKDFSCGKIQSPASAEEYVSSLSTSCNLVFVGTGGAGPGGEKRCVRFDGNRDGVMETHFDQWFKNGGTSIVVEDDGRAFKRECSGEKPETFVCTGYAGEDCSIDKNDCSNLNCVFKESGIFKEGISCEKRDLNRDDSEETLVFQEPPTEGEKGQALVVLEDGSALKAECTGKDRENIECTLYEGTCSTVPDCKDISTIESFLANCKDFEEYDTCKGEEECRSLVFEYIELEDEQEAQTGITSCSRVKDREKGEFVKISKLPKGYEYVSGTTTSFTVSSCSLESSVDFYKCSIDCQSKTQISSNTIKNYQSGITEDTFKIEVKNESKGISGSLSITHNKETGLTQLSGTIKTTDKEITISSGSIAKDGTVKFDFKIGTTSNGTFTIKPDGSMEGTITEGDKTYTVTVNPDNQGEICQGGRCEPFDLAKL